MQSIEQRIQRLEAQVKPDIRSLTDVERAVRLHAMLHPAHPRNEEAMALLRRQGWRKGSSLGLTWPAGFVLRR